MHPIDVALAVVVVVCAVSDLARHKIYNAVTYPAIAIALALAAGGRGAPDSDGTPVGLAYALAGLAMGFLPFFLAFAAGYAGGGDVKLVALVGAVKGPVFVAHAMLYALFAGSVIGLGVAAAQGQLAPIFKRIWYTLTNSGLPGVGPINHLDTRGPRISFGVAVAIGTLIALAGQAIGRQLVDLQ